MLLHKGLVKSVDEPSSFRLLSMLNTCAKIRRIVWCVTGVRHRIVPLECVLRQTAVRCAPRGAKLVGYADDVAVIVTAHTGPLLGDSMNPALVKIHEWMEENGLKIGPNKTGVILLMKSLDEEVGIR